VQQNEDPIAQSERHIREGTERVARHKARIEKMERDGHSQAAIEARKVPATMERTLELAHEHLRIERKSHSRPG
jgi:hypothetical protein